MARELLTVCPRCGKENPADAQFCMRCGSALYRTCSRCGTSNPPDAQFCLQCGTPLSDAAQVERRVLSVLFADLVASTPLTARLDPERARTIIGEYFAAMREEVERHGGVVEKFIGDAVMSVFGLPRAHEDDPERALRAALAMQARLPALNARLAADLHIRIGISTGEVVADPRAVAAGEFMVTGEVVNLAARLQTQAPPDGIVVDERTFLATRPTAQYEPLPAAAGDFADRARWRLIGLVEGPPGTRLRAPLVGREDEMQFLLALYRRVVDGRRPHLVTIIGTAGVGKSRLVEELLEVLRGSPSPPRVLRGRCPAYGEGLTYRPLAEMLRTECGIKDNDPAAIVLEKLRAHVFATCAPLFGAEESEGIVADLASALGVKPTRSGSGALVMSSLVSDRGTEAQAREARGATDPRSPADALLRSLRAFLIAKARLTPVLLVFEDLHWAEESLLDLLRLLVQRGGEAPILLLCLARPELQQRHPDWGAALRNYTSVGLAPLSADFSRRLMTELLKDEATLAEVREAILSRAEGNPFYIQEILRMLIDGGGLVRDEGGWRWASRPPEIRIPDTIHGILASRLDLLSPLEKRAIQDASVAGRVFWLGALIATSGLTAAEATAGLARLQERDLIEERLASSVAGEREFAFTHALIREVAYATVPKAARSDKHQRFADWLERTVGQTNDEFVEIVAIHYEHAWRYRFETGDRAPELARAAVAVLRRAAERARALRTFPEARRLSERALAVLQNARLHDDAETLLEVLIDRTEAVKWLSSPAIVERDTLVVLERAAALGRDDLLARAWLNRAFAGYDRGRLQAAEDALRRALDLFERLRDRRGQAEAFEILGTITEDLRGKISTAQTAYSHALQLYREMGDSQGVARCLAWYGRTVMDAGNLAEARKWLTEAYEFARAHHERISQAYSANALGLLAHMEGDSEEAVRRFQEAIAIRQELGDRMTEANVRRHLAMHHLRWGRLDAAERELQTARALRREHGAKSEAPLLLRGLAEVAMARGDVLAAADLAEQAYAAISEQNEPIARGTLGATLARVRAAQGRREESEELFRQSVEILEAREYRFDLALTLLKYGESLQFLRDEARGRQMLERARAMFAEMGATHFVGVVDARLAIGV